MNKVSFDFDSTLDNIKVQKYAKVLINDDYEVWVVTNRYDDHTLGILKQIKVEKPETNNNDVYKVARKLKIPTNHIHFCNKEGKASYLKGKSFIWHLDDDIDEIKEIREETNIPTIDVTKSKWKDKCNKLLNEQRD
jgi:hypothetical protein